MAFEIPIPDRGIRRRLAPMLGNDRRKLELAFSLLFSLPGTPMMQYGDEIGIGDDLRLTERESARTPMQWTNDPHGGFSRGKKVVAIRYDWRDTSLLTMPNFGSGRRKVRGEGYGWRWLPVGSADNSLDRSDLHLTNPMR
jgi:glycosidase